MTAPGIRRALWGGPDSHGNPSPVLGRDAGEAYRDLDQQSKNAVKFQVIGPQELTYTEPMYLKLASEPQGIIALRVTDPLGPELPVAFYAGVSFVWEGTQARITKVSGMTAGLKSYNFTFLVVG